jgi:signal transduction histidine kinase
LRRSGFPFSAQDIAAIAVPAFDPIVILLALASLAVIAWTMAVIRRLGRDEYRARARCSDLEFKLNQAEAALAAEAQIMMIWRGRDEMPERILGSLHGAVRVPAAPAQLLAFADWLEPDSSNMAAERLQALREHGRAFNIGIRTQAHELLEMDGRAAGDMAIIKFRPLAGERQQIRELDYDAKKLALQVERLSAVLDGAPLPVWLRDAQGKLTWVNRAYVKAVDMADSDSVLRAAVEIAPRAKLDAAKADPRRALLGRAHAVFSGAMRALNIHEVDLAQGRAGYAIDTTELEHAEKELDRHIKAHASTLDKLDTAIVIFGPDQRLRFFNSAYANLWPLDAKWLSGHPTDGEILDRLRTQRCLPEQANYREWRSKHLSSYTTLDVRESWWYLPDGRSLHVVCEQHPFGGVTYLFQNVTRAMQLESRYNELIDVQRETLDNLDEAVTLFGQDGKLKLFNPAFPKFWALDDKLLAQEPHIDQLMTRAAVDDEASSVWQDIKYVITGLGSEREPLRGRLTARDRILQFSAVPLPDGNTLLTFADISDPAKMERALRERAEALEAADRLKNAFLGNISYEVRTPLTSILGFAETLELGFVGQLNPKQSEYVLDIKRSSEDLKRIIDAIIDLSAVDAGAMELKLGRVDVARILNDVALKAMPAMTRRDQSITIELADEELFITADEQRLEQILRNLLSNAIGFSAIGAEIRMGAKRDGRNLQVWVADNGHGIDPEFQKKAFERFQSRPLPGGHRGPGLGLAIVKSFTELHGGKVMMVSKPERGTTVVCSFPLDGPIKSDARQGQRAA